MSDQPQISTAILRSCWVDAYETQMRGIMHAMKIPPTAEHINQMRNIAGDVFDQWLTERDREVKAPAWDEGFCRGEVSGGREQPINPHTENPYREKP